MLQDRHILLGITGGIAAYKAALLVRLLTKAGAKVRVVMTEAATDFIGPITLSTLSGSEVVSHELQKNGVWQNHVHLSSWADLLLVAPCTANTLQKFATGRCDDMLSAVYLSATCPVMVAPAMDLDMWRHQAVKRNLATLEADGIHVLPVGTGDLASGLSGEGRMLEPEEIFEAVIARLTDAFWQEKTVLITAGPTREAIDPVRYISNHSSGKMGVALAKAFHQRGANVKLVHGPLAVSVPTGIESIAVNSAEEMLAASTKAFPGCTVFIAAAAVADYRPADVANEKIKKKDTTVSLSLVPNPDILATLSAVKTPQQVVVGFALETHEGEKHARGKLENKDLDFIVLNMANEHNPVFGADLNEVTVMARDGQMTKFGKAPKNEIADRLVNLLKEHLHAS